MSKAKLTLEHMLVSGKRAEELLTAADLQGFDDKALLSLCQKSVEANPQIVSDYKNGKDKAIMALVGYVMRESKGRANAEKVKEKLKEII